MSQLLVDLIRPVQELQQQQAILHQQEMSALDDMRKADQASLAKEVRNILLLARDHTDGKSACRTLD
jgi:hypothetical protein